jgi:hypothetical protein
MKPVKNYLIFLLAYFFSFGCDHSLSQNAEPTDAAIYKNTVDVLDKMQTNNIARYELTGLSKEEEAFIKTLK